MAFEREAIEKSMTRRVLTIGARALRSRAHHAKRSDVLPNSFGIPRMDYGGVF